MYNSGSNQTLNPLQTNHVLKGKKFNLWWIYTSNKSFKILLYWTTEKKPTNFKHFAKTIIIISFVQIDFFWRS